MSWLDEGRLSPPAKALHARLREERIVWDLSVPAELEALRRDAARIADDMDSPDRPPAMFWSGIPWPPEGPEPSCDYQLVISIGGTKTDFALVRLERGEVVGLDVLTGREVSDPAEIDRVKTATQMATPKHGPECRTGPEMVARMVAHLAPIVGKRRAAFDRCEAIFLSWGFPHRVVRTGPKIAGGLSARVTEMTKDQAPFTESLVGKEIGALLAGELERQTGWSRPVAVANDTVMALHYFLEPSRRSGHARVGLLINGTGTNFSAAEPYAIRPEGFISRTGEDHVPDRITAARPLRPGEREERFFVNYEAGSIELVGTKTRFDIDATYPIERNALAGGNAFSQQLRLYVEELVSREAFRRLRASWGARAGDPSAVPGGPAVTDIVSKGATSEILAGIDGSEDAAREGDLRGRIVLIAKAIVARSALHAALVLAAITRRTGFGVGRDDRPDLLGMEGSVWRTPGYRDLVREYWGSIVGPKALSVDLEAEPSFNASLSGPLYMAAIHR